GIRDFHVTGVQTCALPICPVLIGITKDAQISTLDYVYKQVKKIRSYRPLRKPLDDQLDRAAELINNSKKPYILAGHGIHISGARSEERRVGKACRNRCRR